MFYASLRPLDHLFRSPYQFYSDDLSFWAYREMWSTVPMLPRYIFNSFFKFIFPPLFKKHLTLSSNMDQGCFTV